MAGDLDELCKMVQACQMLASARHPLEPDLIDVRAIAEMIMPAHMLRPAWENRILRRQYER